MSSTNTQEECQLREPIAVVGSACRFPGASSSPSKLWELLRQPRDVVKDFDAERLNLERFYHKDGDTHGSTDVANKSYLLEQDSRLFDAAFFGISPLEAMGMDPQQRILLETTYEAFESAGMTPEQLRGSLTSVHVGVMTSDWANIQARDTETTAKYNATGSANSIMSNRISYVFDLKGPSETIDTACSSSLVAVHNAALGLLNGDCETAVVAGVNLILDPAPYINESKLHMLSPDSRSRMWDKDANGYARGEGAGAVLLKTLSKALKDGDHIEAVIRSTGVNSDGQSPGITMPFAPAQTALIRKTYARAGLDPKKDPPQYFECHGTGTPAGDPVEARAISDAFTGGDLSPEIPLYIGSVKTVIGHLEGGAGIAGLIKVLLAIKHRVIPPNLLFNELNPSVAPFYGPLQIPTTAIPWPDLPVGVPARASVNSFGFGGTNAHAIVESYEDASTEKHQYEANEGILGPLVLSAKSGRSLMQTVKAYMDHIQASLSLDIAALSSVLQSKRSTHRVRAHFSGTSRETILADMADFLDKHAKTTGDNIGHVPKLVNSRERSGILAVFTGQGAQWPSMGRELIQSSPVFRRTINECETVLAELPEKDRPEWSLVKELTADASTSRIAEAAISQPLCTAVQLALVKLLTEAGVKFHAVVGHSSGEIGATYAAGILTLKGAMQISYYRGLHAKLACGNEGKPGGMMAAGLSLMQARDFIARPEFKGRISVAVCNAPRTVALSGDMDAIAAAKEELDKDNIFVRQLRVDTAYHSHHMLPCAEPYLKDLLACDIEVKQPQRGQCVWNSSVRGDTQLLRGDISSLKGQYWVDNMVRTVLFSQAIESSIWHGGPYDLIMEVGPHPALKGPTEQTMKASYGSVPVYTGVLDRNKTGDVSFSAAIGLAWAQLGPSFVDFAGYRNAFYESGKAPVVRMIKDLPTYSWDHDKIYWREGRMSRRFRLGKDTSHELLGRRTLDDNEFEMRWRNVLKLSEMPWLRGHEVLEEVLLPGASYVSIAVEAGKHLAADAGKMMSLVEVENIQILRPVVVPDNNVGVETLFTAHLVERTKGVIRAQFSYYVCPDETVGSMLQTCKGDLTVHIKVNDAVEGNVLPPKDQTPPNLAKINTEQVYSLFKGIGLNYTGAFKSITEVSRCLNYASTTGTWEDTSLSDEYMLHPAILDVAFQTLFVAKAHPASRQITSALLPSHIDRVRVDPSVRIVQSRSGMPSKAEIETWAVSQTATSLRGDLNIYDAASGSTFLQVEGLAVNMVGASQAASDRSMFSKTIWGNDASLGLVDPERNEVQDARGMKMAHAVERLAMFYVKRIVDQIPPSERLNFIWYHQRMFEAFEEHIRVVAAGERPVIKPEWLGDEPSVLEEINANYGDEIDIKLLHAVGGHLAEVVRGKEQLLEVMTKDDMLNRFYMEGYASIPTNGFISDVMKQLTFNFPRAKIIEIGAGTGGTSWSILNAIQDAYDSYTYTDISSGFFPNAAEKFSDFAHKMAFKVLNVEHEPADQGFEEGSYDIVVAALVLHATHDLKRTLRNTRKLLKPGGYLVLLELTGITSVRATFIMGGLEGWWLGGDDGRRLTPLVTAVEWDSVLQDTGFSGADTVVYDLPDESKHCTSLIVSQVVDDDFLRLREPLSYKSDFSPPSEPLLIVGGKKFWTSKVISEVKKLLPRSWQRQLQVVESIDKIDPNKLPPRIDTIVLQDADESVFATTLNQNRLHSLQSLLINSRNMLWVTTAGESHAPRASLIQGITRVVPAELPHLNVQLLGLSTEHGPATAASHTVEAFLRLIQVEEASTSREILWAQEPELEISADGQTIIPRVIPDAELNEMYNASKRPISKTVDAKDMAVEAAIVHGKMTLQSVDKATDTVNRVQIDVNSTLHIPGFDSSSMYLTFGKTEASWVLALSPTNSSVLYLDSEDVVIVTAESGTPENLASLAITLLARSIATVTAAGESVLFFEAEEAFALVAAAELEKKNIRARFTTSRTSAPADWIKIHSLASRRSIKRAIPRDSAVFVNCSNGVSALASTLMASAPKDCKSYQLGAGLVSAALSDFNLSKTTFIQECVKAPCAGQIIEPEILSASDLAGANATTLATKHFITNWTKRDAITLTVKPLEPQTLFKPDVSYFMAGMAGGLGLSICEWMIRNGAKNIVITSRNPKLQEATLEEARRVGATVKVMPMDLTKEESVEAVVREVEATMPPIAGVCNAAMVLEDGFFVDMDAKQLNNTLAAKVLGSEHLDSIFGDSKLDFFICLGSVASVIGNVGQSNYHAANLFMASLIQQRRARGLAASIIHIAYVADVGYVTRQERDRQLDSHFRKVRLMPTSETDVHHAFMEAIRGGKIGTGTVTGSHEIIMGIEPLYEPMPLDQQPLWMKDPRFAHFAPPTSVHSQQERDGSGSAGNIKQYVEEAGDHEEAVAAVTKAFCGKLTTMLQLAAGSVNISRPIIDLGIDSLVAVEIRTWFLKELGADIPVVKILGGDTVEQISTLATKKLMAKMMETKALQPHDEAKPKRSIPAIIRTPTPTSTPALADPSISTQSATSSSPPTPGDSRPPSPLVVIEATPLPLSDRPTIVIDTVKYDSKSSTIVTALAVDSDSASSSDKESVGQGGIDVESEHSGETDLFHGETAPPELLWEQPMSPAQARMWFMSKHSDDPAAYNMVFRYQVKGPVSLTRLRHALSTTVHHHEALRTCFFARLGDGQPMQGIVASSLVQLKHVQTEDKEQVDSEMKRLATRHWDLHQGKAFELVLISHGTQEHDLFFAYHHILMDVVGLGIILRDLNLAYQMKLLDRNIASYLDYSSAQLDHQNSRDFGQRIAFWKSEFPTIPETLPLLPMASVTSRPTNTNSHCHHQYRQLKPEQLQGLKTTCQRLSISQFHFHLALLQVLLAKYTGAEDICVGIVDSNRSDPKFAQTVGYFVNMLPVRTQVSQKATFSNLAKTASRKTLTVLNEAAVPFDMLLDQLKVPRSAGTTPLFQAALNYRLGSIWEMPLGDAKMELGDIKDANNPFDLSLGIAETPTGCVVELYSLSLLYSQEGCSTILDSYIRLLEFFSQSPRSSIDCISVHDGTQVAKAMELGNGPAVKYDWAPTLSQRLQHIISLYPNEVAVRDMATQVTYTELNTRLQQVAEIILRRGCTKGSCIAVLCEPSLDFIVSMLAVLHVGAVYMPLDVSLPASRHASMVKSCQPLLLLRHSATEERVRDLSKESGMQIQEVLVDSISNDDGVHVPCAPTPDTPAVLLFTSGSTGSPKGIILTQANFVNHLALKADLLRLKQETVLQQSSLGFDMSLIQTFCALANGGRLIIAPSDLRRDPVELPKLISREQVTLTIATPSEYLAWHRYGVSSLIENKGWRHACMGGEKIHSQLKAEFLRLGHAELELTNCYGPTEITAAATFQTIPMNATEDNGDYSLDLSVGKALPNYFVRILDTFGLPQPIGHTGVICIGGAGVATGYLDLPVETSHKFITTDDGQRLYITGDKGRLLPDGTLLYLSRLDGDTQVKLRGLRVELEEVEKSVMEASEGLFSGAVVSLNGNVLVVHVTLAAGSGAVDDASLFKILARIKLPQYFIPASITIMSVFPTTSNGKVDRKTIAAAPSTMSTSASQSASREKMTVREGELRLLWERVLPAAGTAGLIVPLSDFFSFGGNSILLMKLQAAIRETMMVKASTRVLYQASTLRDMAQVIDQLRQEQSVVDAEHDIDWAAETAIPTWLVKQLHKESSSQRPKIPNKKGIEVMMTGATCFLGGHLLRSLLVSDVVTKIHCIAVLADDQSLLPQDDKVVCYTGSLLSPTLGLTMDQREDLARSVDVIIHAGASGHCLNTYASLRIPNVHSTQFLAFMSASNSIPLLFLSSNRVVLLSGNASPPPTSVSQFHPSTDGLEGHMMSRWASEIFLENLVEHVRSTSTKNDPWIVSIHRPSVVISDQAPNSDALNAILRFTISMRCVPRLDKVKGYLDLAPLENVVAELSETAIKLAQGQSSRPDTKALVQFKHHSGGVKAPVDKLRVHLSDLYNVEFQELEMKSWLERASESGMDPLITAYMDGILENDAPMMFPYMGEQGEYSGL